MPSGAHQAAASFLPLTIAYPPTTRPSAPRLTPTIASSVAVEAALSASRAINWPSFAATRAPACGLFYLSGGLEFVRELDKLSGDHIIERSGIAATCSGVRRGGCAKSLTTPIGIVYPRSEASPIANCLDVSGVSEPPMATTCGVSTVTAETISA